MHNMATLGRCVREHDGIRTEAVSRVLKSALIVDVLPKQVGFVNSDFGLQDSTKGFWVLFRSQIKLVRFGNWFRLQQNPVPTE